MNWIIDNKINLTEICEAENWHLASVRKRMEGEGIDARDAEAFAAFAFADEATVRDDAPEDLVTDEQYNRLTVR